METIENKQKHTLEDIERRDIMKYVKRTDVRFPPPYILFSLCFMYSPVPFLQQSVQETNQNKQVRPTEHTDVDRTAMQSQGNNNTSRCYQWKWNPLNVCDGFVMFP